VPYIDEPAVGVELGEPAGRGWHGVGIRWHMLSVHYEHAFMPGVTNGLHIERLEAAGLLLGAALEGIRR
jgi:hypothetical protein